jgi:hypothetical protein
MQIEMQCKQPGSRVYVLRDYSAQLCVMQIGVSMEYQIDLRGGFRFYHLQKILMETGISC